MKSFQYTVQDALGLHARPAGQLVKEASQYKSQITLSSGGQEVACNRLIALMGLQIKQGASITITVEGEDEEQSCMELLQFLEKNHV